MYLSYQCLDILFKWIKLGRVNGVLLRSNICVCIVTLLMLCSLMQSCGDDEPSGLDIVGTWQVINGPQCSLNNGYIETFHVGSQALFNSDHTYVGIFNVGESSSEHEYGYWKIEDGDLYIGGEPEYGSYQEVTHWDYIEINDYNGKQMTATFPIIGKLTFKKI